MADFPFLWLRHGRMDIDYTDKCEEVFLWFESPVPKALRKKIERGCPPPLAGMFHWGESFVYFGSAGDSYEYAIVEAYGGEAAQACIEEEDWEGFIDLLGECLEPFEQAVERWVRGVHAIAPIVLFMGPNADSDGDVWAEWSEARVAGVMGPRLAAHERKPAEEPWYGYIRQLLPGLGGE